MASPNTSLTPEQLQRLLNGPASAPPAGVLPNFNAPSDFNKLFIATLILCISFSTSAILLRTYIKIFLIRSVAYEDYVIIIAWIGQIIETIPSGYCTRLNIGSHMWNIQLRTFFKILYWINATAIVYCPVVFFFVKLSILPQYLRVFVPTRNGNMPMYIGTHICIWSCFIFYSVQMSLEITNCTPREKIWNPFVPGHCFHNHASFLAGGIFNIISDFAILILPMPVLWRLQVPLRKKLMMIAVFATGILACVASILRTNYNLKLYKSEDVSYNLGIMGLWTYAEIAIGIIVSCLPVLPKFFQHFGPKFQWFLLPKDKIDTKSRSISLFRSPTAKARSSSKNSTPLANHTQGMGTSDMWKDSGTPKPRATDEDLTLDDYETPPPVLPKSLVTGGISGSQKEGNATVRNDLEAGYRNMF